MQKLLAVMFILASALIFTVFAHAQMRNYVNPSDDAYMQGHPSNNPNYYNPQSTESKSNSPNYNSDYYNRNYNYNGNYQSNEDDD